MKYCVLKIMLVFCTFIFFSCERDETEPDIENDEASESPKACFAPSKYIADTNDIIEFTNCSEKADKYVWDFDDGTGSTAFSPTHKYSKKDVYIVTFTAYNTKGRERLERISKPILVGSKFLSRISISEITFKNEKGVDWDLNDGPDVYIVAYPISNMRKTIKSPIKENVNQNELPFSFDFDNLLTNEAWIISMYDSDKPENDNLMAEWQINPYQDFGNSTRLSGDKLNKYSIKLDYIIK